MISRLRHIEYILLLGLLFTRPLIAETLKHMEAITSRYATLAAFLKDPAAVLEYREALKAYMGEGDSFDEVYKEFIRQIKEVNATVRGFGEQAWAHNPDWEKESFVIKGEYSGSGLQIKREAVLSSLEKIKAEINTQATAFDPKRITEWVDELKQTYGLLPPDQVGRLSPKAFSKYQARLAGDKKTGLVRFQDHPAAKNISNYITNEILQHDERLTDALYSGDADIIASELKKLRKISDAKEFLEQRKIEIAPEVLTYLNFQHPSIKEILASYEEGVKSMKDFRAIADARMDPALLARIQEIQAQGVETQDIPRYLNASEQALHKDWQEKQSAVRRQKTEFKDQHNGKNPLFAYELHEDPARRTLRLKADTGTELQFIPSPRPFHAFFAGRKTQECVGGRDANGLVPKRWARAALKGAVNLFTETGDGKMEGMVALTRLTHVGKMWKKTAYDVVDLMSRAIKGDVVVRDSNGRPLKYSFFDFFVDRYVPRDGSHGLVISDGNSVSQNIAGGEVVLHSPAYMEDRIIGKPSAFRPFDPMAKLIARYFPRTLNNYGDGGMIYDGMRGDGTKVVRLVPVSQRRKWSKQELEDQIIYKLLNLEEINDNDLVWKRARESQVPLMSLAAYRNELTKEDSALVDRVLVPRLQWIEATLMDVGKKTYNPDWFAVLFQIKEKYDKAEKAAKTLGSFQQTLLHNKKVSASFARILSAYPGSKASVYVLKTLRDNLRLLPRLPELRSPQLLSAIGKNARAYTTGHVATYLKQLAKTYPNDKSLVAPDLVQTLALTIDEPDWFGRSGIYEVFYEALSINPRAVLSYSWALNKKIAKDPEFRTAALGALFSPAYKRDLVEIVKSGDAPFVNNALAQRVSESIPEEILSLPDARTRRQALGPSQSSKIDCNRLYKQLYLQYVY